jgi:hypothetical protein
MNYTKLKLNDQEIGLKFGMVSDKYLSQRSDNPFLFDGDGLTEVGIAHVVYSGYLNNCAHKDMKPEITFEQVAEFVEDAARYPDKVADLTNVIKVWTDVQIAKKDIPEESKKKTTKKSKS